MKEALGALPGVTKVDIDFDSRIATCSYDSEAFDGAAAKEALATAGFPKSELQPEKAIQ